MNTSRSERSATETLAATSERPGQAREPRARRPSISAFFPCYNDATTIGDLVLQADETLKCLTDDHEIIVVNDGSRDNSAEVLRALSARVGCLRVVTHDIN